MVSIPIPGIRDWTLRTLYHAFDAKSVTIHASRTSHTRRQRSWMNARIFSREKSSGSNRVKRDKGTGARDSDSINVSRQNTAKRKSYINTECTTFHITLTTFIEGKCIIFNVTLVSLHFFFIVRTQNWITVA